MAGKVLINKLQKAGSLVEAAQELFLDKGVHNTSIDEIVKKANVAKGTFYLYFTDKYDLMNRLVLKLSARILGDAYDHMLLNKSENLSDNIIFIADYIIEYFKKNPKLLRMVEKNFSWPLIEEALSDAENDRLKGLLDACCATREMKDRPRKDVYKLLFFILDLCGATAHGAIVYEQPAGIDEMKPFLYQSIRALVKQVAEP